MYDMKCGTCGAIFDLYVRTGEIRTCTCGGALTKALLPGKANAVIGDECDVWIKHALCNADGSPRRYTSKTEIAKEAAKRGWTNHVEHMPAPGTDKNRHTTRWV